MSSLLRPTTRPELGLAEVFGGLDVVIDDPAAVVTGITLDSRTVTQGDLYVALPGTRAHGADFAAAAQGLGAAAILTDPTGADRARATGLPVVVATDARAAMATAAANLFGRPTHQLTMFGITGTNGKTTTCFLVEAGLVAAHQRVGTIGTNGFRLDGEPIESSRTTVTTPESPDLQALMAVMLERGADAVAMEVSSHALALQRVNEIGFDVTAFTNLGRDHLDFHPDMEDYFAAKSKLFGPERARVAVVNIDDEYGQRLAQGIATQQAPRLVGTGFGEAADYRILDWQPRPDGAAVHVATPHGEFRFTIELPGEYNVRNAVMALAMLLEAGIDADAAIEGLSRAHVPGRMQLVRLEGGEPPVVLVDFAHTPQAIAAAIAASQPAEGGRRIVVVGAGGDRDKAKRAPMGEMAALGADVVVVTDDNPRTEDPAAIRGQVAEGARGHAAEVHEVGGRADAIATALRLARPSDVVLLLGKGHEQGQTVGTEVLPFDDVSVACEQWRTLVEESR